MKTFNKMKKKCDSITSFFIILINVITSPETSRKLSSVRSCFDPIVGPNSFSDWRIGERVGQLALLEPAQAAA